jgi:hypothetical protein
VAKVMKVKPHHNLHKTASPAHLGSRGQIRGKN